MDQTAFVPTTSLPSRPPRALLFGLIGAIGVVALIAFIAIQALGSSHPAGLIPVPLNPDIEAKWGIRVTQVASTADGGMVDFRFIVLDPDKAGELLTNVDSLPVMRAEDSGTLVNSAAAMDLKHDLFAGRTYFLLYRNTLGSIRPGTEVTVSFGDLKIEHVVAR